MSRNCTVKNQTRRQVSFQGRSGRFRHLPPMASVDMPAVEIADNAFVEKLVKRRILSVVDGDKKESAKPAPDPAPAAESTAGKKPRASLSKLTLAKEAKSRGDKGSDDSTVAAEPPIETGDTDPGPKKGKSP